MEVALSHSKTWPVNTLAVVQLRVDSAGKAYSTFMERVEEDDRGICAEEQSKVPEVIEKSISGEKTNGVVLQLSEEHLEIFSKMSSRPCRAVRTDTVSTVLDQELETDFEVHNDHEKFILDDNPNKLATTECITKYESFHVLALAKMDEKEKDTSLAIGRRPSIKIENWDLVYTESSKAKCQIHGEAAVLNTCACKSKSTPPCMDHTDCMLPELPLDARKVTTLRRHYYPESGWGWVIIVCSVLVHILNHGIQLSASQLVFPASGVFKISACYPAGTKSDLPTFESLPANFNHIMAEMKVKYFLDCSAVTRNNVGAIFSLVVSTKVEKLKEISDNYLYKNEVTTAFAALDCCFAVLKALDSCK